MHRAGGWWCMCVCRGREWEEAGKTQSDFSTPPSVFKECRMGPRGCSTGDHFAPPTPPFSGWVPEDTELLCRGKAGWVMGKYARVSPPGALCSQPCPPRPAPAVGLPSWACVRLRGDYNSPVPFHPTGASVQKDGREVRGD